MLKVLNENYFIDLDEIEKFLDITEPESNPETNQSELKINVFKYEMIKLLLETILSEQDVPDEKLGLKASTHTSLPFRMAFNTLLNKKLINYY